MECFKESKDLTSSLNVAATTSFRQTSTLATLLPDEILKHSRVPGKERRRFECALLLADVSGFTALCEKYTLTGKGGTYRLTKTLNAYIGKMVQEIIRHGGDVLKFSGDAFLACWKVESDEKMALTVNEAVKCALYIQEMLGEYETDVNVALRVKLAISAGTATFSVIGNEENRHYILVGDPIAEVRLAEYMCVSGDIILSPSAWNLCDSEKYIYSIKGDLGHIKIIKGLDNQVVETQKGSIDSEIEDISDWESVRVIVVKVAYRQDGPYLRPFTIPPVLQQVDHEQPLEYLTEMRQVVTMFVNVITSQIPVDQFITLVDDAYCIICRFTKKSSGCVNKVSLFDKDLMFLVVFGLRGCKHEMEIKNGLRCAANCHSALSLLKGVNTVSIGVTTGMTYCGVVGHPMRREYTVIGSPVNKAARIMVAYPGKVTCERNTFLHSKLPASFFHLQEAKELKGLSSVGPIYEFMEEEIRKSLNFEGPNFPILGRDTATRVFLSMLAALRAQEKRIEKIKKLGKVDYHQVLNSGIAYYGEPRIGKTRLLEELADLSRHRGMPALVASLTSSHRRSPYAAAAFLFQLLIGIDDLASIKEKEEMILSYFGLDLPSNELCYLNDIFQVNFLMTDEYKNGSNEERVAKRQKIAKKLLCMCCSSVAPIVVIGVDDIHHMDPPSAVLFSSFLDCDGMLMVVTVTGDITSEISTLEKTEIEGTHFLSFGESQAAFAKFYNHPRLFHYPLTGLALELMAPLACQILDVRGIPPELETVLQNESQGNPGWVESYLVSLMQTGALIVATMDVTNPHHETLVFPKEEMVTRHENEDVSLFKIPEDSNENGYTKQFADLEYLLEEKKKEAFSYKHHLQMTLDKSDTVMMASVTNRRICLLAPHYNFEEASIPKTMNGVIMTAFDSLNPFAQLLVKIASVLGNTCMRMMLVAVMNYPGTKKVAEAVKDVFDARIICCGRPGSQRSQPSGIVRNNSFKPDCYCHEGYRINVGANLPKYAFCSLLKFRTPLHRDTAYDLLTDDQKKDIHSKAVNFLEGEAHRCSLCGGGPFFKVPSLFAPLSEWLSAYEGGIASSTDDLIGAYSYEKLGAMEGQAVERMVLATRLEQQQENVYENIGSLKAYPSNVTSHDYFRDKNAINDSRHGCHFGESFIHCFKSFSDENKQQNFRRCESDSSLGICLSKVDLRQCECHLILSTIYIHLIEHTRAAGLKNKLIPFLIEFGAAAVPLGLSTQAAKLLGEAEKLLQEMEAHNTTENQDSIWFAQGKIKALQGQALFDLGQHQNALVILMSALKIFGHQFPRGKLEIRCAIVKEAITNWMIRNLPCIFSNAAFGSRALYSALSECLSLICKIKMAECDWPYAELAAIQGLNMAERTKHNFVAICRAYSDSIEFSMKHGYLKKCHHLEAMALRLCRKISGRITLDKSQLFVVAHLYYVTFNSRLLRGEVDAAIRVGYRAMRLSDKMLQSVATRLQILPLLVQSLLISQRFSEVVDMLQELARLAEEDSDSSATTWYHALCLDLLLDTGFTLEKYVTCKAYADERMDSMSLSNVRDPAADRRLLISLWLWCIRCERWEEAMSWEDSSGFSIGISSVTAAISTLGLSNTEDLSNKNDFGLILSSFPNLIAGLKYLEGLQLILVGRLDIRGYATIPEIHRQIVHVTAAIEKSTNIAAIAKPRFLHLQAHFNIIRARTAKAMKLMREATSLCEKYGNKLEAAWIEHNKKVWLGLVTSLVKDFWRDHCNEEAVDWHEDDIIRLSSILFSLPIPRNFL